MDATENIRPGAVDAAPSSLILSLLTEIHDQIKGDDRGALASYIPELTRMDPALFGICLATADGHVYAVGDCDHPFTIQSISKAFVYGLALSDRGEQEVLAKVGVEPSGEAFNAIVFDERGNRPFNPMVNAGAIATTALVNGADFPHRLARILDSFRRYAGHPLAIDEAVFASEKATGHRNRAIAFLELNFGMIDEPVDEHLDLYFKQCSILVTARDLAVMAATLANGGINPLTRERAITGRYVRSMLSVMTSCGMYDYSGEWLFRVGLAAKSGVGGGVIAVLPGQFGLGVFSPRLDEYGNSVRGVRVCEEISSRFGLHTFDIHAPAAGVLRRRYRGNLVASKRQRTPAEMAVLTERGGDILVYELQGELHFITVEQVLFDIERDEPSTRYFVLNGKRVSRLDASGRSLLIAARDRLAALGKQLLFARFPDEVRSYLLTGDPATWPQPSFFSDLDIAIEWCEARILDRHPPEGSIAVGTPVPLAGMDLTAGFSAEELAELEALVLVRSYTAGEAIFREGDPADAVCMLCAGSANVELRVTGETRQKRLASIGPGVTFGETALLTGGSRTADVIAHGPTLCYVLAASAIDELLQRCPAAAVKVLRNLGVSLANRLAAANREIRALEE